MSEPEPTSEQRDAAAGDQEREPQAERAMVLFGRGVRTALRNNATAYGFSLSITSAFGMAGGAHGQPGAGEVVLFVAGAAVGFVLVGVLSVANAPVGSLPEGGQVMTISGGIDILSVAAAVAAAFGLTRVPGALAWPLTGLGTVITYLAVGGLDVLIARAVARRTSFGRAQ